MNNHHTIYIGIGSNQGDRLVFMEQAVQMIGELDEVHLLVSSSLYESPAMGFEGGDFLNAVIAVSSSLSPDIFHRCCQNIEKHLGKHSRSARTDSYQSRNIDIDLLEYGNISIQSEDLILPHPEMNNRLFVMKPLIEVKNELYSDPIYAMETIKKLEYEQKISILNGGSPWFNKCFDSV